MPLREDLKNFIPKFLWNTINHPQGYIVSAEEFNSQWNLNVAQGDHTSLTMEQLLDMLYETILNDTDGAVHIFTQIPGVTATNVKDAIAELKGNITVLDQWRATVTQTLANLAGTDLNLQQQITAGVQALVTHKTSTDHDGRYYEKSLADQRFIARSEMDTTANVSIKTEVFRIVNANVGDGTFTYMDASGSVITGVHDGTYQHFALQLGDYTTGENRINALVNDTLHRSVASGGLLEVNSTTIGVAAELSGAEVTVTYFTITGSVGSSIVVGDVTPNSTYFGKLWVDTKEV